FHAAAVTTALRLRCPDELVEQRYKAMQQGFTNAEQQKTCAAISSFLELYALDFELADVPEMEKANGLRTKLCQQEARDKEVAALEKDLQSVLSQNDCAAYKKFEKQ